MKPNKPTGGNRHIRLRDDGSKDKLAYIAAVEICYVSAGNNCTFQTKHFSEAVPSRRALYAACHAERPVNCNER